MNPKQQLKKLSKEFNLKYDPNWFNYLWISKREARYLEYIGMCFDPIYTKFGKTAKEMIKNIEKFERSKELKKILHEYSGQAITKPEVLDNLRNCKLIKNKKLKNELTKLNKRILKNLKEKNLALLTKTNKKKEKEKLLNSILVHEWIHLLLIKNKIYFQEKNKKLWKYDEGLVTYLEFYIKKRLNYLEYTKKRTTYASNKKYYIYAIKFREILKNVKTPKEKLNLIKELKKKLQNNLKQ